MISFTTDLAACARIAREENARHALLKAARDQRPLPERMDDAMLEMAENGQIVDAASLAQRGFTRAEIDRHGADAADRATALRRGGGDTVRAEAA